MHQEIRNLGVLISVFNDQIGLNNTLKSIDGPNLKVWVIDDGSSIPINVNNNLGCEVVLVRLDKNVGLIAALNLGLDLIENDDRSFVFRIDAGDVYSYGGINSRLITLLEKKVGIVGGSTLFVDERSGAKFLHQRETHSPSKWFPLRVNYIHSGVLFCNNGLRYDSKNLYCEDVFLFYDIEKKFGGVCVCDEPVTVYQGGSGISTDKRSIQLRSFRRNIFRRKDLPKLVSLLAVLKILVQVYFIRSKSLEIRIKSIFLER